jgi:cytosine/creatinine deaminase
MKISNVIIPAQLRGFSVPAGTPEHATFDIYIENSAVVQVSIAQAAINNVANGILIPALADVHVHIDKTYVVNEVGAADGDLYKAINLMAEHRARWTAQDIATRMERALQDAYAHGTRALRTHLDWPERDQPTSLKVFEQLRDAWRGRITLQCVALTQLDFFDTEQRTPFDSEDLALEVACADQTCNKALGEAALLGAFVYRNERIYDKLQRVFDLAMKNNLHLDFHVDEGLDADARGLRAIAELTIKNNYHGKVTCGHACSLSVQPVEEAMQTLKLCAQAGIHLVALPTTNLYLQGAWNATPVERGITRIKEAMVQGLSTSIATDNVADGFYPYGSYDLLASFAQGVQVAHLSPAIDNLGTITTHPARAMGLPWDGKIQVGCPADLVLLEARNTYELVNAAGLRRQVIRAGTLINTDNAM